MSLNMSSPKSKIEPEFKNWKDDLVSLINTIITAETSEDRELEVDELLDTVEDLLIMTYIRGRNNGQNIAYRAMEEEGMLNAKPE